MTTRFLLGCLVGSLLLAGSQPSLGAAPVSTPVFEKDVLPILTANCLSCHGGLRQKNGLDLRTVASIRKGGESGVVVQLNKPEESLLWKKVAADEMPKTSVKLSADDKKVLRDWIAQGMPTAAGGAASPTTTKPRVPAEVAADLDRFIEQRLAQAGIKPAPLADDAEFLRRVYLDVIGRPPTIAEARKFLDSTEPGKRQRLIEDLLASPDHGKHWAMVWHNLMLPLVEGKRVYEDELLSWLASGFNEGRGWDRTVGDLLSAQGPSRGDPKGKPPIKANPPVAFAAAHPDPDKIAQKTSKLFLGFNLECAECHNHPFTQWRQKEDFWGMAAFFSGMKVSGLGGVRGKTVVEVETTKGKGKAGPGAALVIPSVALTAAGQVARAHFPGGEEARLDKAPYRPALAEWLTARDNPYFAAAAANRWWAQFFGRGLVEPLDDFASANLAALPETLRLLAHELRVSGHDARHLVRCICTTRAYQRTSRSTDDNEEPVKLFGRMALKMLPPEVLFTALTQALEVPDLGLLDTAPPSGKVPRTPQRALFVNRFDLGEEEPHSLLLYSHGVLQILQLLNMPQLNEGGKIAERLAASERPPAEIVEEFYLAALARRPTPGEQQKLTAYWTGQTDHRRGSAGILWLLFNTSEFVLNH